ncbi:DUF1707 SHOCT-like domain-containing protein [Nocardia shimofusensis]|uniref:DUF1707 SHOCT-like domain-containing protein n=1 Tax=Nocardia shimofusensis TaxID=228596 RepID=UPI0012EE0E03|nr:DUF1707 domain-containing protein [Nocardia shimofusensis]
MGDRDLRVSDAEREHVGQLLQRAVGLGMLSLGEFTERMDTALAAKTRGELNAVLIDLPGVRLVGDPAFHGHAFGAGAAYRRPPAGQQASGNDSSSNVIRARISEVSRRGRWNVPPTLHLNNWAASVTLDFTEAVMSTQVVEIFVDDFCSSLNLVVPAEATVNLDGLELIAASVANKVRTGPPLGPLHVVVRGRVRFGSVTAKRPLMDHWRALLGR